MTDILEISSWLHECRKQSHNKESWTKEIAVVQWMWFNMVPRMNDNEPAQPELLRVHINPTGKFDIVDFTTARRSGRLLYQNVSEEDIPAWVIEAISMLRIADEGSVVQSVGFKVNDKLYYIVDRRDENENEKA